MLFCGPVSALPESPFIFSELKASTCLPLRHLTGDRGKKKQTAFKSSQLQIPSSCWQWINICIHAPEGKEIAERENRRGAE